MVRCLYDEEYEIVDQYPSSTYSPSPSCQDITYTTYKGKRGIEAFSQVVCQNSTDDRSIFWKILCRPADDCRVVSAMMHPHCFVTSTCFIAGKIYPPQPLGDDWIQGADAGEDTLLLQPLSCPHRLHDCMHLFHSALSVPLTNLLFVVYRAQKTLLPMPPSPSTLGFMSYKVLAKLIAAQNLRHKTLLG